MTIAETFIIELEQEAATTRKLLERIPEAHLQWKPHEKSMTLGRLGMHVAELTSWIGNCIRTERYDFGTGPYKPHIPQTLAEIKEEFETKLCTTIDLLRGATDETLAQHWKVCKGDIVVYDLPKRAMIRQQINHIIHHRGQLSVYLRLLQVPLPHIYGPSADER